MAEITAAEASKLASAGALTGGATGSSTMDKNAFLQLLVTQFQYQDPLNPMEDKEFVAQLAQFTSLEQSMSMNENLEKLLAVQQQSQGLYAANYIGMEVLARGYGISIGEGGTTVSKVEYSLDTAAVSGFVNIFDANNELVTSIALPELGAGIHTFQWDGKNIDGRVMPDGVYNISISATDADGNVIVPDTQVGGKVMGISTYNGEQYLTLEDGRVVSINNVRELMVPGTIKDREDEQNPGLSGGSGSGSGGGSPSDSEDEEGAEEETDAAA